MTAEYDRLMPDLAADLPWLRPILAEHLEDNEGELLPHLLMFRIHQWVVDHCATDRAGVERVLGRLEDVMASDDADVRNVVSVSFLEHWPTGDEPGAVVRRWLPPRLAGDLAAMERPRPPWWRRLRPGRART